MPVPVSDALSLSPLLPVRRAYVRPWVADFLEGLSADYFAAFHVPLQVNSAVRTVKVQRWLLRTDRNAAPWHGDVASAHLAGVAVDLERRRLTAAQKRFLELRLLYWAAAGQVLVEEELRPEQCFHIVVRKAPKSGVPDFTNLLPDKPGVLRGEFSAGNFGFVLDSIPSAYLVP